VAGFRASTVTGSGRSKIGVRYRSEKSKLFPSSLGVISTLLTRCRYGSFFSRYSRFVIRSSDAFPPMVQPTSLKSLAVPLA